MRHRQGCNRGAGVWPRAFVLQDSALRLCHRFSQSSLKVIAWENLWGMNKPLFSKHFCLWGMKGPNLQGHLGAVEEEVDRPL